jgi:malate:Na+ symporter
MVDQADTGKPPAGPKAGAGIARWWRLMEMRVGIIPVPIFVLLAFLVTAFSFTHHVSGEISMALALMALGGFTCAEIGKRLPFIRNIGAAAIFATFIPSALVYYQILPTDIVNRRISSTSSSPASLSAPSCQWTARC